MAKEQTILFLDSEIKAKAEELFADFGLDLSEAINLFLKQCVMENTVPSYFYKEIHNADTMAAMKETEEMAKHPEKYKSYTDVDEMMADLLK